MEQNTENTALLVMDMQEGILGNLPDAAALISNAAKAIAAARKKKMPVIFVVVGFRQGMPEISMQNKGFRASKERMAGANMNDWMKIHSDLSPLPGEITVVKRRVSAFTGSDLEVVLRAQDIRHLVLTGIATGGVVLSTTREAADKDYGITILSDACADADEEIHRVLINKIFPRQAEVMTVDEWSRH
jgi:nicotinamidase-related amidase